MATQPTIYIDILAATFDGEDNIITANLVDSIEEGTPILSITLNSDVPVPEEGLVVNVNSDNLDISQFVEEPAFAPFTFGGEFLGAIYNDAGVATGFQVQLLNPNAIVNFSNVGLEEGIQSFNLFVEPGENYTVSDTKNYSTVTVYDTLEQVPTLETVPKVGMSISKQSLIEGETETTISFNVDGEIPPEGVLVLVDSDVRFGLGEFDLFNATIEGGVFPVTNGDSSGFYFKITEPEASISLIPRNDNLDPDTGEVITEGIEKFTFTLQEQAGYTIDSDAAVINFAIADDVDARIQVSLITEPEILVEESGTVSVHTFNLSSPPPEDGITVRVIAEGLDEFDLSSIETTGISGEIAVLESFPPQLVFTITEQTATINLPIKDDGITEGLETVTFTLAEPGEDALYQISSDADANKSSFDIYDTLNQSPVIVEDEESNDTIETSIPIAVNGERTKAIVKGEIDFNFGNNRDVDQTEDVDMYSVELEAGSRITLDLDSIPFENSDGFTLRGGGDLRIFNAAGEELVYNAQGSAPGELLNSGRDAYIDFTAETAGTYYIGVSQAFNENYDPNIKGSGDGALLSPSFGLGAGEYELNVAINPDNPTFEQYVEFDGETPADAPVVNFAAVPGTFEGNDILSSQIIESLGAESGKAALLNFTFQVDGEIPEGGLEVIVKSDTDFSTFFNGLTGTPRTAVGGEIIGAIYNQDGTPAGFKALLTSSNASFPFSVSSREEDDPDTPESIEFSLANSPNYTANSEFTASNITFYDTLEQVQSGGDIPEVGVTIEKTQLIESEATEVNITFNVNGDIPEDGLLIYVDSETRASLGEFDVFNAEVTGGVFPSANGDASGFYFRVFENTANIKLQVFDETTNPQIPPENALEGIEKFTFSIIESDGYTIDINTASFTFTIADNPESVVIEPPIEPGEGLPELPTDNDGRTTNNDTIANAVPLGLNLAADNLSVTIDGEISERFRGAGNTVDATEDVDMYSFELQAGQTITIDIDANGTGDTGLGSILDSNLRIFDADGNELVINSQGAAADEIFQAEGDPYLEFTAPETGTYYAGISALGNDSYDPNLVNSGSGWTFGERFGADVYRVTFSLGDMLAPPVAPTLEDVIDLRDLENQSATFTVNREAAYNNTVGFYLVNPDGSVTDPNTGESIKPNQIDYAEGAIANRIDLSLTTSNGVETEFSTTLAGGNIYAPFLVINGDISQLTDDNPDNDPQVFFTFPEANPDGFDAIRTSGNLNFGFEDIPDLDNDFNDLSIDVVLTPDNENGGGNNTDDFTTIFGSINEDTIEVEGTNQLIFAGDSDDLIDASIGSEGNNRIYAGSGDDTVILGMSDRIIGGTGDDKFFVMSGGDNIITGGEGADQFWIATVEIPDTANTITDFSSGEDVLGIAGLGIGFEDLSITQQDNNTLIAANGSDLAILQGVDSLMVDNFAFV